jgi:hypothetical protein
VTTTHFVCALGLYLAAGVCVGAAFVTIGVGRALQHPMTFTPVARLFLFPGAVALWPYILFRWLKADRT